MEMWKWILVIGSVLMIGVESIFSSELVGNFTVSKIDPVRFNESRQSFAVDSTASKIACLIRIGNTTDLQIYHINGTLLCSQTISTDLSESYQFYWPPYQSYSPLLRTYSTYSLLNQSNCAITQTFKFYDLRNITQNPDEQRPLSSDLIFRNTKPTAVLTGIKGIYEVDIMTSKVIASFMTKTQPSPFIAENIYSKNLQYMFAHTHPDPLTYSNYTMLIWDLYSQYPIKNVSFNKSQCSLMGASYDSIYYKNTERFLNSTIISLLKMNYNGAFVNKITLKPFSSIYGPIYQIISDTGVLDSMLNYTWDNSSSTLEVINIDNQKSIQKLAIPYPYFFQTYSNRLLIVRFYDRVLIYKYMNDNLWPDDGSGDPTTWIIIVCVLVVVLVIGAAVFYFIRKKKLAQKNGGDYGKLNDQV